MKPRMLELEKSIPNTDLKVPFVYKSDRKDADFFDFNFDIEPHGMASQTPGEKMQSLRDMSILSSVPYCHLCNSKASRSTAERSSPLPANSASCQNSRISLLA